MINFWKCSLCFFAVVLFSLTLPLHVYFMCSQVRCNFGNNFIGDTVKFDGLGGSIITSSICGTSSSSGEIDRTLQKESRPCGVLLFSIRFWLLSSEIIVSIKLWSKFDVSVFNMCLVIASKSACFLFFLVLSMEFKILDFMAECWSVEELSRVPNVRLIFFWC